MIMTKTQPKNMYLELQNFWMNNYSMQHKFSFFQK